MAIPDYFDLYGANPTPEVPRARVPAFVDDPVARAARARALGAVPPAGVPPPVPPAAPATAIAPAPKLAAAPPAKPGIFSLATLGKLAKGNLALAPVVGGALGAVDSQENVRNFAGSVGLNYDSFGGRVGANVLNALGKVGDAATFGGARFLSERVGRVLNGGTFFDPYQAPAPVAAAQPLATVPQATPTVTYGQAPEPVAARERPLAPAPELQSTVPYVPLTRTVEADGNIRITGAGQSPDYLARQRPPTPAAAPGRTAVGAFYGAGAGLRQIANDNANRSAAAKLAVESQGKGAINLKNLTEAHIGTARLGLARQAAERGADEAEVSAILSGRAPTGDRFSVPAGVIAKPGDPLPVLNTRKGTITNQTPQSTGSIARATDGKYYRLDANGKATVEATAAEVERLKK